MEHDMSNQLEDQLRAAFEAASEFVQPPRALADRVRASWRRRRRRRLTASLSASTACVLLAAGGSYLVGHEHPSAMSTGHAPESRFLIKVPRGSAVVDLAAGGSYVYVVTGQDPYLVGPLDTTLFLAAYNRTSGRLVHEVKIRPGTIVIPTVGSAGRVWVSGWRASPAPVETWTWLFSPDLRLRSVGPAPAALDTILPVGPTTALVPVPQGLMKLQMPAPGRAGRGTSRLEPGTGLGAGANLSSAGFYAGIVAGRVAVEVSNSSGHDYHLVIAGDPNVRYSDNDSNNPMPFTVSDGSVWLVTGPSNPLVRLNAGLKPTTPGFVRASTLLAKAENVWSYGGTVWVSTAVAGHSLVCFAAGSQHGPVVTMPVTANVAFLAADARAVYVSTTSRAAQAALTVRSYPVPAVCR
jgi:hypothetical protein